MKYHTFQNPVQTCPTDQTHHASSLLTRQVCIYWAAFRGEEKGMPPAAADLLTGMEASSPPSPSGWDHKSTVWKIRIIYYEHLNTTLLRKSGTARGTKKRETVLCRTNSPFHLFAPSTCPQPPPTMTRQGQLDFSVFKSYFQGYERSTKSVGVTASPTMILKHWSQHQPRINMLSMLVL